IAPPFIVLDEERSYHWSVDRGTLFATEAPSLCVNLEAKGTVSTLGYTLQVFPQLAAVRMQFSATTTENVLGESHDGVSDEPTGIETDRFGRVQMEFSDILERLSLAERHLKLRSATFYDRTDIHNEFVQEKEWLLHSSEAALAESGNVFVIEQTLTGNGLILIKEAPLPHARFHKSPADLVYVQQNHEIALMGHGMDPNCGGEGYTWATIAYSGGRWGCIQALQSYQRCLRSYDSERDAMFLSNTWGDRSRDSRINETFMMEELDAASCLGVDILQIDDGWELGRTVNSVEGAKQDGVWEGYWDRNPDFWTPDPERFPKGLEPLAEKAKDQGVKLGLWFGPDSASEFVNWKKDAEVILKYHRELEVNYVKLDGIKLRSKKSEQNLYRFINRVLCESDGVVVFDLDITAEVRPGYWGMIQCGPLFVENRYTDWHGYWPHQTLRNLWMLSHYVDPLRLRMEFLNQDRNLNLYVGDPLAPNQYDPDYLFATTMFSNPLGWFEVSHLPESYSKKIEPLVQIWKQNREGLFSGQMYPIGDPPDGASWTGFMSISGDSIYILVFRELNQQGAHSFEVPEFLDQYEAFDCLYGAGKAQITERGLTVEIDQPQRFIFGRFAKR
ncbi:MAG: alpha-galactosidase, partial [Verrucomicrobiota bacterium]